MTYLQPIWKNWLKLAEMLGNLQMILLLTIIYWFMLSFIAIPFKVLSDPLQIRKPNRVKWIIREQNSNDADWIYRQG